MQRSKTMAGKALLLAILYAVTLLACQKDKKEDTVVPPPPPPPEIPKQTFTTGQSDYAPSQGVDIRLPKGTLTTNQQFKGTWAAKSVDMIAMDDSTVVVLAPSEAAGTTQTLTFTVSNKSYTGSVKVKQAVAIPQPDAYINTYIAGIETNQANVLSSLQQDTAVKANGPEYQAMQVVKDSIASMKKAIQVMTATEKAALAQFIQANLQNEPPLITDLLELRPTGKVAALCDGGNSFENYNCTWSQVVMHLTKLTGRVAIAIAAAKVSAITPMVGVVVGAAAGAYIGYQATVAVAVVNRYMDATGIPAWNRAVQIFENPGEYFKSTFVTSYSSDAPAYGSVEALVRNMTAQDEFSTDKFLSGCVAAVKSFNATLGRLSDKFVIQFKAARTVLRKPYNLGELQVEVVDNAKVIMKKLGGTPDKLELTFSTAETTPQTFKYDIVYSSKAYPPVRIRHTATVTGGKFYLGDLAGDLAPVKWKFEKRGVKFFTLLDENWKVAKGVDYKNVTIGNQTNAKQEISVQGQNSYFEFHISTSSPVVESGAVDILYSGKKVATLQLTVNDSTDIYTKEMIGNWKKEIYAPLQSTQLLYTDYVSIKANGEISIYKSINPDGSDRGNSPDIRKWTVDIPNSVFRFYRFLDGWGYTEEPMTFPPASFKITARLSPDFHYLMIYTRE